MVSERPLPTGRHTVGFTYVQDPGDDLTLGGTATLFIDGKPAGTGRIDQVVPSRFSATETLDVGMDLGGSVSKAYRDLRPFAFDGTIHEVKVSVD